jgi:3-oxoacyl-[acyl-carrier protein] reductase|tara:strand:+ start:457 stop:1158 length:702 start_codon:yes stop_codon:yes gene_type:complete
MDNSPVMLITGTRKGIGEQLVKHYVAQGFRVIGCSRKGVDYNFDNYQHFCLDVSHEAEVKKLFFEIKKSYGRLDCLINNAGIALANHILLTPCKTVQNIMNTNFTGTFLFCREGARLMKKKHFGRIVNLTTVATPLKLAGEAVYASSKAAIVSLTQILGKELAEFGITVNAIGPTPIKTDLIRAIPKDKIEDLIDSLAIKRYGEVRDVINVIDFFIKPESDYITGQVIYLGGV